jgi:hypothetical protein
MIILVFPSDSAEDRAADAFAAFASAVHARVPDLHSIDLHAERPLARGICGDCGRVVPTRQGLCPICAGYLHDADQVQRMREMAARLP